jgi:transposase
MTTGTVLVGRERRRRWTTSEKLRLVEESFAPGASVAEVARRHEVHPNQLHGWRNVGHCPTPCMVINWSIVVRHWRQGSPEFSAAPSDQPQRTAADPMRARMHRTTSRPAEYDRRL